MSQILNTDLPLFLLLNCNTNVIIPILSTVAIFPFGQQGIGLAFSDQFEKNITLQTGKFRLNIKW